MTSIPLQVVNVELGQAAVESGEPKPYARAINMGLIAAGLVMSTVAYPYREKVLGYVAASAGAGMAGIGLAFLFLDIVGAKPAGSRVL